MCACAPIIGDGAHRSDHARDTTGPMGLRRAVPPLESRASGEAVRYRCSVLPMLWSPRQAKVERVDQRAAKVAGVAAVPATYQHAPRRGSNPLNALRTECEAVIAHAMSWFGCHRVRRGPAFRRDGRPAGARRARGRVFRLVVLHGGSFAMQGLVCGVLLALWMGHLMGKYVYHVSATNGWVLGGSAVLVLAVSLGTTLPSARRAATMQPARVLKS